MALALGGRVVWSPKRPPVILAVSNKRAPQGVRLRSRLSTAPSFGSRLDPNAWLFA